MESTNTQIGTRLELFVDDALIDAISGPAALRLHSPVPQEIALTTDRPWEGNMCGGYKTVFRDGPICRLYYQCWHSDLRDVPGQEKPHFAHSPVRVGYAESDDGIRWRRPALGLCEIAGAPENNIVFAGLGPEGIGVHGFAPFTDANPDCAPAARYKALGAPEHSTTGRLYALQSPDGLRWTLLRDTPVLTDGAFDSQNLAFWDALRGEYRAYYRDFQGDVRGIKTATSQDFQHWTAGEWLEYPGSPAQALYTNQIVPYYRAPHLFVGFPARYVERRWSPSIEALPEVDHRRLRSRVTERYGTAVTDGLFMASRDAKSFKRWDEAFLRPGLRTTGSWCYGDCYQAWGILETPSALPGAPDEMSLYATEGYWRGQSMNIRRYTLRVDGFVSLNAPLVGGELVTRPLVFAGDRLLLNISTSAAGSARVELQSPDGRPLEGHALDDCYDIIGDTLAYTVRWRGGTGVRRLAGQPVRLRFALADADLYSYRFAEAGN